MNLKEKKISSQLAYDGYFLKVRKDKVLLPNGNSSYREYIHHPGASMIIPVLSNGNLVMIKQFRYPLKKVFIEFPAGKIEKKQSALLTAKKELKEETGYEAKSWKHLTTIHPVIGYADEKIEIFLAKNLKQTGMELEEDEHLEVIEVSVDQLFRWIRASRVTDVKTQIGAFWLRWFLTS